MRCLWLRTPFASLVCDGRLREHWGVNPYIVKAPPEGAGFDTTLTDGLRIAVRDVIADATVPRPTRQFAT